MSNVEKLAMHYATKAKLRCVKVYACLLHAHTCSKCTNKMANSAKNAISA